ncbi:MAG: DUF998 domain-containing protein [Candidatus Hadarchaeales archaeon]
MKLLRISGIFGLTAPAVLLLSVLAAVSTSTTFSWSGNALSDLGTQAGSDTLFNTGLTVAGALVAVFSVGMIATLRKSKTGILASLFLLLEAIALAGIGIFTENTMELHITFAVAFFALTAVTRILFAIYFFNGNLRFGVRCR